MRRHALLLVSFGSLLLGASIALQAQAPPMSNEFVVNTYTTGFQYLSSVAVDGAGDFVVAWDTYDGSGYGIAARAFDFTGAPLTGEFAVNSYTTGNQYDSWVAADRNGDFVVVWTSYGQLNATDGEIYARRYVGGQPTGPEFLVNTYTTGEQYTVGPAVAMALSGEFVVVWVSNGQDGDGNGVFAQRFDAAGNKVGAEFQVNTYTTGNQTLPAVAMNAGREFVVTWESFGQDGDNYAVIARRYDATGTPVTGEVAVNTNTTGFQIQPVVAMDKSGNFVVVWDSVSQDGNLGGIFGRRFDPAGTPLTGEFQVNTYTTDNQDYPAVAMDPTGNFVCTWRSDGQDGSSFGVYAQAFNSSASRVGSEFLVNVTTTGPQELPAIAMGHHDNFVVTWGGYTGADEDIFATLSAPYANHADVDARSVAGSSSNANGVLESGETVQVATRWSNVLTAPFAVSGTASDIRGPAGPTYTLNDTTADYGNIPALTTHDCFGATADCYLVTVLGRASGSALGRRVRRDAFDRLDQDLDPARRRELPGRSDHRQLLFVHRDALPQRDHGRLRRRQLLPDCLRHAGADGGLPPEIRARSGLPAAGLRGHLRRRALPLAVRRLDRAALPRGDHRRLRRRQLLSGQSGHPRPDGRLPVEGGAWLDVRASDLRRRLRRRRLSLSVRRLDRAARGRADHRRLPGLPAALLPEQPEHARPDGRLPDEDVRIQALPALGIAGSRRERPPKGRERSRASRRCPGRT